MSERKDFAGQVAEALRRVEAPQGFAERLRSRALAEGLVLEAESASSAADRGRVIAFPRARNLWMSGAIAAALVVGTFVGVDVHRQHERERATQEFETATRITDKALEHTREQLARAGVRLEE